MLQGDVTGTNWHDLDGDGSREQGEPGVAGWTIYAELDGTPGLTGGDVSAITDVDGNYTLPGLPAGLRTIAVVPMPGWTQTAPAGGGTRTVVVQDGVTATGINFGNKRDAIPFTLGNVLISKASYTQTDMVIEFTPAGEIVQAILVPGTENFGRTLIRDLVIDQAGNLQIFTQGDFIQLPEGVIPFALLNTYDPIARTFTQTPVDDWAVGGATSWGDIAAFDKYVFVNDHDVENNPLSGIIRFDITDLSFQRFSSAEIGEPGDLTIGLDGLLYTMTSTLTDATVNVFDPVTMQFIRTIALAHREDSMVVDANGHIFSSYIGVRHYDPNGVLLSSSIAAGQPSVEISNDGSALLMTGSQFSQLFATSFDPNSVVTLGPLPDRFSGFGFGTPAQLPLNIQQTGEIHGFKWDDQDGDGVWDTGEPGLDGGTVELVQNGQMIGSTVTGDDPSTPETEVGAYWFTDLAAGDYTVREVLQAGWEQTFPGDTGKHELIVAAGQIVVGAFGTAESPNFGNQLIPPPPAEIHGFKWDDQDGDSVRDAGEPGLVGWTIYLDLDDDGVLDNGEPSMLTMSDDSATPGVDETGMYSFTDLTPGIYVVAEQTISRSMSTANWCLTTPMGWQRTFLLTASRARCCRGSIC